MCVVRERICVYVCVWGERKNMCVCAWWVKKCVWVCWEREFVFVCICVVRHILHVCERLCECVYLCMLDWVRMFWNIKERKNSRMKVFGDLAFYFAQDFLFAKARCLNLPFSRTSKKHPREKLRFFSEASIWQPKGQKTLIHFFRKQERKESK